MLRLEAALAPKHLDESPRHEARRDDQDEGERDLADEDPVVEPLSGSTASGPALTSGFQGLEELASRRGDRRDEADQNGGDRRDAEREQQDGAVERDLAETRHVRGSESGEQAQTSLRDGQAEEPSGAGEQKAVHEIPRGEPAPGGAERPPQVQVVHAGQRAREDEARDVGGGDEEDRAHRAEHQPQRTPSVARRLDRQRSRPRSPPALALRDLPIEAFLEEIELGLRAGERDAASEARHHGEVRGASHLRRQSQGKPHLGPPRKRERARHLFAVGKSKAGRHHADDHAGFAVQRDLAADGGRVRAEALAEEGVADDRDPGTAGGVLLRRERPPHAWRHAERGEEAPRDPDPVEPLGIPDAGEVHHGRLEGAERLEGAGARRRATGSPGRPRAARRCRRRSRSAISARA